MGRNDSASRLLELKLPRNLSKSWGAAHVAYSRARALRYPLEVSLILVRAIAANLMWQAVLLLIVPGIAATTIFVALLMWSEFLIPVMLAGNSAKTLRVFISDFISARNLDWGLMAAASSLAILPIAIPAVLAQRRLILGLSSGAIKV